MQKQMSGVLKIPANKSQAQREEDIKVRTLDSHKMKIPVYVLYIVAVLILTRDVASKGKRKIFCCLNETGFAS